MNTESKLIIACRCGDNNIIKSFKNYKKFQNCTVCMKKNKTKLRYSDVLKFVSESGGILNTTNEEFDDKKMTTNDIFDITCRCGNNVLKTFGDFKTYPKCKKCKSRPEYDEILTFIVNSGGKLDTSKEEFDNKKLDLNSKLDITCSCSKKISRSFCKYKINTKCQTCNDPRIYSYSEILSFIAENGGKLNTSIKEFNDKRMNSTSNLDITCKCGISFSKSFGVYKNSSNCQECSANKTPYQDILTFITKSGCELNTCNEEFTGKKMNTDTKLTITCICGEIMMKSFSDYKRSNQRCYLCVNESRKTSYQEISEYIDKSGGKMNTSEDSYKQLNSHSIISIICICGEIILRSFIQYKKSSICIKCIEIKRKATNIERYGRENCFQNEEIKDKIKATNIERYGCENPMQNEDVKAKTKETWKINYGKEHPMQSKEIQDKSKASNMGKYGVDYYVQSEEFKTKYKETCLEKYGVENYVQSEEYKIKSKTTCLEKYGVEHPMQNPGIFDNLIKKLYKRKEYIFPSGKVVSLQGYEPYYMDKMLELYDETEILTDAIDMPEFWYYMHNSSVPRIYYPDFYIPKDNLVVEIKSTWTFSIDISKNMQKFKTVKYSNFNFKVIIFDSKKNFFEITHLI
jgi:hypothetical protein